MTKFKCKIKLKAPITPNKHFGFWISPGGFTFVEVLTAVAVLLIIVGIIMGGLSSFRRSADLGYASDRTLVMLREARRRTIESYGASSWGVHFESSRVVLFRGNIFVDGAADSESFVVSPTVHLPSISLQGGGSNVVFIRISGATNEWGTIALESSSGTSRVITIYASGLVEAQ